MGFGENSFFFSLEARRKAKKKELFSMEARRKARRKKLFSMALCGQHRTVPDCDVAAICQTPGRSCWVRLPSNIKEKGMECLASRRKGVLVFWWLRRDGTDRTGACTGEKN